jgi:hypothetical protein
MGSTKRTPTLLAIKKKASVGCCLLLKKFQPAWVMADSRRRIPAIGDIKEFLSSYEWAI